MKKGISLVLLCVATAGATMLGAQAARAPDALTANPEHITLKLENAHVRVLEAHLEPGQKENAHSHPGYIVYAAAGGTIRVHQADGTTTDLTFKTGDVTYREPVAEHWGENVGTTATDLILVELKYAH
jgi:quercetin dioxygenase-like cupin family protein